MPRDLPLGNGGLSAHDPLNVSPLTWSHAEYSMTVRWHLGRYHKFKAAS